MVNSQVSAPPPLPSRNKIEELQQRKEADLKAQLARTQKLQQELEAANQVSGWIWGCWGKSQGWRSREP